MYTQHPILTEKHRIVDIFADLLKKKNWNITWSQVFRPFAQYLVEAPFWFNTAMSLFGKDATSFSHLDLGILCHSSLQILSSSVRLDGKRWWTAIFRSLQRCSIGFKSGLWLGHSRTVTELLWSHSFVILAVCLGSLSCWKVNLRPSLRSWALWRRFSSRISLYLAAFIFPSIATSRPVPAAEKHPHSMMLPPPCFTVGTVLDRWWAVPGFLHTYRLELRPKSSILDSSDQRILFVTILESFRCFLANSMRAFICLALRRGFRRATLP